MPGNYPAYHSLIQKLAGKVITRVVKNGEPLSSAIKEAIAYAELDRQQIIHLCAILQEYSMPYNGDPMDFFRMSEDMGKDFPNPADGYVVYANAGSMQPVFAAIDELKTAGFTKKQIIAMNEELAPVLDAMDQADGVEAEGGEEAGSEDMALGKEERIRMVASYMKSMHMETAEMDPLDADVDAAIASLNQLLESQGVSETATEPEFAIAASSRMKNIRTAQPMPGEEDAEAPSPDNIKGLLDEANAPAEGAGDEAGLDLGAPAEGGEEMVSEDLGGDDLGGDLGGGGEANAKVTPTPAELKENLSKKPEWSVDNILSIQKAENFLEGVRKQLEAVVFNENIVLDPDTVKQYDQVREMIDAELEKIKDAQKETKKLEDKENDLQEEFQVGDQEVPTEEMITPSAAPAPAPAEETVVEE